MHRPLIATLTLALLPLSAHAALYSVTDLTLPGSVRGYPAAINNLNQVVGSAFVDANNAVPFLYANGQLTDFSPITGGYAGAADITDAGLIAGTLRPNGPFQNTRPFLLSGNTLSNLGPAAGKTGATTLGLSPDGSILVGFADNGSEVQSLPVLYANGAWSTLPILPGYNYAQAGRVNNAGHVIGISYPEGSLPMAGFLYKNNTLADLSTLAGLPASGRTLPRAIDEQDHIVGTSNFLSTSIRHAFLFDNGTITDLGSLPSKPNSEAYDLNTAGQIVGYATSIANSPTSDRAFLYQNNTMTDLNTLIDPASGWTLLRAYAINDNGLIIGYGHTTADPTHDHPFLLSPIPEPASLALLAPALLLLKKRR